MEWINVKHRTPEEDVPVVIYCKNGAIFVAEMKIFRWPDGENVYWIVSGPLGGGRKIVSTRITHWIPLPKPPKE